MDPLPDNHTQPNGVNAIESHGLVKMYGAVRALDDVSIQVHKGEIFGFLGPNGAGKSTFVKILLNLVCPSAGTARIFGRDVHTVAARRHVGFLPENIQAYRFLTVDEFLCFHARLSGMSPAEAHADVARCRALTGVGDAGKKRLGTLSKGMLQRVGIAQALVGNPQLLIMDEPTSGLDPVGIRDLRTLLLQMKGLGMTVFLNSHLLSEVERTCDRVAILNRGKIITCGTQSDVSRKNRHLEVAGQGINTAVLEAINAISARPVERQTDLLRIYLHREEDSVLVHKMILEHGGRLASLSWKGESLEELFYRLVKDEDLDNS